MEALKKLVRSIDLDNKNGATVAVLIALIVVSIFLASYYVLLKPPEKGYMTIYLLDSQKKAVDYPELLVINQNNTFNVWVEVENHMIENNVGISEQSQVLQKITNETIQRFPLEIEANNTYEETLAYGETWEISSTITINTPGNYSVAFELWVWVYDKVTGELQLQFSGDVCVLNMEVVDQA